MEGRMKASRLGSRFEAEKVVRAVTLVERGRLEIHLKDSRGQTHVVSLPLPVAVDLGSLIRDASDAAPYLLGGHRQRK
jgi:hypothetical protein